MTGSSKGTGLINDDGKVVKEIKANLVDLDPKITKLEEARHWLNDLIDEAIEEEEAEKNEMTPSSCGVTDSHLNSGSSD